MTDEIIQLVKSKELTPEQALAKALTHSTRLGDIPVNLNSRALLCGLPTMERYQYLLEKEGNLVVMAARPGNGKTSLACQIGLNVSKTGRVLMFSLEMKKEALKKRLLSVLSNVPIKKLSNPLYQDKISAATRELQASRFDVIDDSDLAIHDIVSKTYDEYNREKLDLVIIDYLGMIKVNNEIRATAIAEVARRLKKDIADRLKIPVLALAQMNRSFDGRKTGAKEGEEVRPNLSDIGESSGIEHASDVVMFLHRPYLYDRASPSSLFKVYVAKNRNGEVKDFNLEFSDELTKFFDNGGF